MRSYNQPAPPESREAAVVMEASLPLRQEVRSTQQAGLPN